MSLLKGFGRTSPIPRLYNLLQHGSSAFAHKYSTAIRTPEKQSFTENYLISNCGFSPETALTISQRVLFKDSENPESVLTLFRSCGFSDSQLREIIRKSPRLLQSDPIETIWPKLDFLLSKGASCSQLINIVTISPVFLLRSLENHIMPSYNFVKRFVGSDQRAITSISRCLGIIGSDFLELQTNIRFLLDIGVPNSGIARLLYTWPSLLIVDVDKFKVAVEEVKKLGIDPSKSVFLPALYATNKLSKSIWKSKVDLYKKWGWSDEEINKAFALHPNCMLKSLCKITAVMEFFVKDMGWESAVLANNPIFFSLSLEKRIIPRASVLQYLHSRGSIKNACIAYPYYMSEEIFLQKFVRRFEDEAPQSLKLYEEKMNLSR